MKKIFLFITLLFLVVVFVSPVSASVAANAGVKPGSFFYFFDTAFEKVNLFFTFNPENKAKKAIEYADERLAEIEAIAEEKNPDAVKTAIANYENNVALATEKSKEVKDKGQAENLLALIENNTSKNQEVLADVLTKVPEEAKDVILKAIEVSKKGQEEAIRQIAELKSEVEQLKKEVSDLKENTQSPSVNKTTNQTTEIEKLKKEVEDLKNKANQSTNKSTTQINAVSNASTETTKQKDESYKIISLNITPNFDSARFEWATTFPSESKVFFWEDGDSQKNFSQSPTGISLTHMIDLGGLLTDTKYCFQIEAISNEGATTTEGCFKTLPVNDWVIKASNLNPNKSCSELAHVLNNEEEIRMCEAYFRKYKKSF